MRWLHQALGKKVPLHVVAYGNPGTELRTPTLMNRYFFDVVRNEGPTLDYTGRSLRTDDEAYNAIELMALDLAVKQVDEVIGSKVTVSDVYGRKLFSIPVKESYLAAVPIAA
jgi:hypothetical protein